MMRKSLWIGTALVVFGAASAYLAASHAVKNPESLLGRCARGMTSLAPLFGCGNTINTTADTQTSAPCAKLIRSQPCLPVHEPIMVDAPDPLVESEPSLPQPPLDSAEESDAPPTFMPLCPEDETGPVHRMPYADDDDADDLERIGTDFTEPIPRIFDLELPPADDSEQSDLPGLPGFREDPHHDHHYPSCPYTGRFSPPSYRNLQPATPLPPPNSATPNR